MKKFLISILPVLAVLLVFGCGGGQGVTKIKKGPMPPGARWTGTYFTNWGEMELSQTGSSVVGTFGERNGHIEGTADGNILVFHWTENQKSSLTSTKKKVEGSGFMRFYIIKAGEDKIDEHRIEGTWGYGSKKTGGGKWSGYKSTKDVKAEQRIQMITKGAATKSTSQVAGDMYDDYVPPPGPSNKSTDDLDDIPPPTVDDEY